MMKVGFYEILISSSQLFCNYNTYIENSLLRFRRDLNQSMDDKRLDFSIENCTPTILKEALKYRIGIDGILDKYISFCQQVDASPLSELRKNLPKDLSVSFVVFDDERIEVNKNICFHHPSIDKTCFDYIFLHQYGVSKIESAITSTVTLLKEAVSENLRRKIRIRDMKIFEEIFLIEGNKATYLGFLDNHKAEERQPIFEIGTSLLIMIFETFNKMLLKDHIQSTPFTK